MGGKGAWGRENQTLFGPSWELQVAKLSVQITL